ncbi:hypothetical protein PUN28_002972 [Cardiocondyla obscurior]|uniref:Uncharacterized protein n=1 Tax=Cardiocondyla obscurior TaxID=286306 RepID=A0AAW2GXB3_9HYME
MGESHGGGWVGLTRQCPGKKTETLRRRPALVSFQRCPSRLKTSPPSPSPFTRVTQFSPAVEFRMSEAREKERARESQRGKEARLRVEWKKKPGLVCKKGHGERRLKNSERPRARKGGGESESESE